MRTASHGPSGLPDSCRCSFALTTAVQCAFLPAIHKMRRSPLCDTPSPVRSKYTPRWLKQNLQRTRVAYRVRFFDALQLLHSHFSTLVICDNLASKISIQSVAFHYCHQRFCTLLLVVLSQISSYALEHLHIVHNFAVQPSDWHLM